LKPLGSNAESHGAYNAVDGPGDHIKTSPKILDSFGAGVSLDLGFPAEKLRRLKALYRSDEESSDGSTHHTGGGIPDILSGETPI
jgi:hypothetical protein